MGLWLAVGSWWPAGLVGCGLWQEAGPQPSDHPPTTRLDTNLEKFDFEGVHASLRDGGFLHVGSSAKMRVDEINLGMVWWRVGGCRWLVASLVTAGQSPATCHQPPATAHPPPNHPQIDLVHPHLCAAPNMQEASVPKRCVQAFEVEILKIGV